VRRKVSARVRSLFDFLALLKGVEQVRNGYVAKCPGHHDTKPSLNIKETDGKILIKCFGGCRLADILEPLGLEPRDLFLNSHRPTQTKEIVATFTYHNAEGKPLFEVVRFQPKSFAQRLPGHASWGLHGIRPVLYHLPEVLASIEQGRNVFLVEGEAQADRLREWGLTATTSPMGACKWRNQYSDTLTGAKVIMLPDNDVPGMAHMEQAAKALYGKAGSIKIIELPELPPKGDILDWQHTKEELHNLVSNAMEYEPPPPTSLHRVIDRGQSYLFMPDTGAIEVLLGAVAANLLPGDPVWLLLIGPPGWGKTENLNILNKTAHIHHVAVLTEASLLSGTPRRDSQGSKGGLLREMGDFGILLIKDFGGVLSLTRETRGPILAALREVYDGAWTRYVGSDGGRALTWSGKAGLVGGATPAIDQHYAVMAALGERFCYYRLPETDETNRAERALEHAGHEVEMRGELANLVSDFFTNLTLPTSLPLLTTDERSKLVALATFTTRCRSAVERDSFQNREIQLVPGAESPTRLVKVLLQLLRGLEIIGIAKERAWEIISKVALDSMPALRQRVIKALLEIEAQTTTSELAKKLGYPSNTTRRVLEDLGCYGIVKRKSQGEGRADYWSLTEWTREMYTAATRTLPEILSGRHS